MNNSSNQLNEEQLNELNNLFNSISDRQLKDFGNITASNKADGSLITSCDIWSDQTIVEGLSKNKDCNNDINTNEDFKDSICDY